MSSFIFVAQRKRIADHGARCHVEQQQDPDPVQHKQRLKTKRVINAQCQAHVDLVTVELDYLVGTGRRFAHGFGIVAPTMANLAGACCPGRSVEIPVRQRADIRGKRSLAEVFLVEWIFMCRNARLPALRKKAPVHSPRMAVHFGRLRVLPASFSDLAIDPARDVRITLQQLGEGAAGVTCDVFSGWLNQRAAIIGPRMLIGNQRAAAEDAPVVVLRDASLEDTI